MPDPTLLMWSAVLTFVMVLAAGLIKYRAWTPQGLNTMMGNREHVDEPTGLARRADRAAANMIENMVLFTAVFAAVHFSGQGDAQANWGATLFFWARLIYWPVYLAGIPYLRTGLWAVAIVGIGMMALSMI